MNGFRKFNWWIYSDFSGCQPSPDYCRSDCGSTSWERNGCSEYNPWINNDFLRSGYYGGWCCAGCWGSQKCRGSLGNFCVVEDILGLEGSLFIEDSLSPKIMCGVV